MDLKRHLEILWRYRRVTLGGFGLGLLLAFITAYQPGWDGGPTLEPRGSETWSSQSSILVTQNGFPWGRVTLPGQSARLPQAGELPAKPAASDQEFADPGRFSSLALLYSVLSNSDRVRAQLPERPRADQIQATAVDATGNGSQFLPVIRLTTSAASPAGAVQLNVHALEGLGDLLRSEQAANDIPEQDRVQLSPLDKPSAPALVQGRSLTPAILLLLLCLLGTFGLAHGLNVLHGRSRGSRRDLSSAPDHEPAATEWRSLTDVAVEVEPVVADGAREPASSNGNGNGTVDYALLVAGAIRTKHTLEDSGEPPAGRLDDGADFERPDSIAVDDIFERDVLRQFAVTPRPVPSSFPAESDAGDAPDRVVDEPAQAAGGTHSDTPIGSAGQVPAAIRVDAVVVATGGGDAPSRCAASLAAIDGVAVTIVDNGAAGRLPESIADLPVALIRMGRRGGAAAAAELGIAQGSATRVLLLEPDISLREVDVQSLLAVLDNDSAVGAVAPRIVGHDGKLIYGLRRRQRRWSLRDTGDDRASRVTGACLLLRRDALEHAGGLPYGPADAIDYLALCTRVRKAGWDVQYEPLATARREQGPEPQLVV